ncbi:hypothetical protein C8F04DRAFT_1203971 [Mycena alexandri]|uniref:Uncharacterized protein n=1 Tax=Mycena alexandri TaxID=1745969 RepID=A0AAD6WLV1_9AGAR|nr:hypothetical protein C8F04DRAFT_1203971 [Mycena alexandri]
MPSARLRRVIVNGAPLASFLGVLEIDFTTRNQLELRQKARERMAKRRAKLKMSEEAWTAYTAKAREDAARYRAQHAEELALNQAAYRARKSIAKRGFAAWHDGYLKRHPRAPPQTEDLPEWPSDSENEDNDGGASTSAIPPPPPESAPYQDHLNYFLDYQDPTTAPNYIWIQFRRLYWKTYGYKRLYWENYGYEYTADASMPAREFKIYARYEFRALTDGVTLASSAEKAPLVLGVFLGAGGDDGVILGDIGAGVALDSFIVSGKAIGPSVLGLNRTRPERQLAAASDGSFRVELTVLSAKGGWSRDFSAVEVFESVDDASEAVPGERLQMHLDGKFVNALASADTLEVTVRKLEVFLGFLLCPCFCCGELFGDGGDMFAVLHVTAFNSPAFPQKPPPLFVKWPPKPDASQDTIVHDGRKEGRYFVVGAGHCGSGVFTNAHIADLQTNGFSGYAKRSTKRWTGVGGVEELWASFCDEYHRDGCHAAQRLPSGWDAPTPVVRGCPAPAPVAPAPAPVAPAPAPVAVAPPPSSQPRTPHRKAGGSGTSAASPLFVPSSQSPPPLRPPPQYHPLVPNFSAFPTPRTALNPNGGATSTPASPRPRTGNAGASTSAGTSALSALGSTSSVSSISSLSRTPKKPARSQTRVASSPNSGHDTDYYYDEDSDGDHQRYWAVRGLEELYTDADEAFDALRQNMHRLRYMEVRTSTNAGTLRRFAAM